jgi:hypothetical protein
MSLRADIEALRAELEQLAGQADTGLGQRYALWHPPGQRRTLYRRFRKALGRLLRRIGLRPTTPLEPWLPGLKHIAASDGAKPLVIWAIGADQDQLRKACKGCERILETLPDRAPVLVTDIADFAFYSRLGWLIEYVPTLSEPAGGYRDRKRCYLAWRYRGAPALPVSIGLAAGVNKEDLLLD